jgi:hypothetical protein
MPMPRCAMALRSRFRNGMVVAWYERGMGAACVNQTRTHCVNQMGKTQSRPKHSGFSTLSYPQFTVISPHTKRPGITASLQHSSTTNQNGRRICTEFLHLHQPKGDKTAHWAHSGTVFVNNSSKRLYAQYIRL